MVNKRFQSNSILYNKIKVQEGKNNNKIEEIFISHLKQIEIKGLITFNTTIIENTILTNKKVWLIKNIQRIKNKKHIIRYIY